MGKIVAVGTGKVRRWKGWWRNGLDNCASLKNPTECWISKQAQPTGDKVQSIQEALASSNEKDLPVAGDSELEMIYLDGSEVGLLGIHRLVREGKAILRSGDGSTTGQDMSAGVYRAEDILYSMQMGIFSEKWLTSCTTAYNKESQHSSSR